MSAAAAAPISPQHAPLTPPTTGSPGPVSPASSGAAADPNGPAQSAAGPARRKTSRRANTAERRATHNAVERQRRETLNGRFLDLAALLPNLASVRRPSKSAIVNSSIALIHTQRRARALAGRELRVLKAETDALRRELNEWRDRANLPRVDEGPRSAEFQALMVLDDADEAGEDEVRRAYEMAAIPCGGDDDGLEYDSYEAQPVPPSAHPDFHAQQQQQQQQQALHPQLHAAALHMQQQHQAALQQQPRPMSVHIPTQAHFDQQTAAQLFAEPAGMSPTADKVAAWQLLQHQQQQQQYHHQQQQHQQQMFTPPPSSHGQRFAPYPPAPPPPQPVQFRSDDDASSVSSARSSGSPPTQTGQFDMPPTLAAGATPADFARFWAQPQQPATVNAPFGQPNKVGYPMGFAM
ncbi:hypothetical protein AURDEDRAFT_116684 [Auricularia subglabra TFB-10046 SS5]|nr:hypothetical protein AURDEDRAFT_116684 [Auricularia subglabra TFB-10046 SS5]